MGPGRRRAATIAGYRATTTEHELPKDDRFPEIHAYTYVIDVGRYALAAQLITYSPDRARYADGKRALDAMMQSLRFTSQRCRNRNDDIRCGSFYWATDPAKNRPVAIQVNFSPPTPAVGELVTFTVTASDPDADVVDLISSSFGDEGPPEGTEGLPMTDADPKEIFLSRVRSRYVSPGPYGRWFPPPISAGTRSVTLFHQYREVGDYQARFFFRSSNSRAPGDGRDPYMSAGDTSVVVPVR